VPGFRDLYCSLIEERLEAKKAGNKLVAETYKLALNGFYGNLNNQFSWAYYPPGTFSITVNGQLFLLMLVEALANNGCQIVSANTDGITFLTDESNYELAKATYSAWEQYTGLTLEEVRYKKLIRRDINNYMAITDEGKVKRKGVFDTSITLGKGYNFPIVMKAVSEHFLNGTDIAGYIKASDNIYDFCKYIKVAKKFEVYYGTQRQQQINRFYCSRGGQKLLRKKGSGKFENLNKQSRVTIANQKPEQFPSDINYGFYIMEAQKTADMISPRQLGLFG